MPPRILITVLCTLAAALAQAAVFVHPLGFGLALAPLIVLIPAIAFGPLHGVMASLPAVIVLVVFQQDVYHPIFWLSMPVEALVIGFAARTRTVIVVAMALWIVVLGVYIIAYADNEPLILAEGFVRATLGLGMALLARSVVNLHPYSSRRRRYTLKNRLWRHQVCLVLIPQFLLAGLAFAMLVNDQAERSAAYGEVIAVSEADSLAQHLASLWSTLEILALQVQQIEDPIEAYNAISAVRSRFPSFLSLLQADADGRVVRLSSSRGVSEDFESITAGLMVADREYFRVPRDTGERVLTSAFRGRGVGDAVISAMALPLYGKDGEFGGVLEASMNLNWIQSTLLEMYTEHLRVYVVDADLRVLAGNSRDIVQANAVEMQPLAEMVPSYLQRAATAPISGTSWQVVTYRDNRFIGEMVRDWCILISVFSVVSIMLALTIVRRGLEWAIAPITRIVSNIDHRFQRNLPISFAPLQFPAHVPVEIAALLEQVNRLLAAASQDSRLKATTASPPPSTNRGQDPGQRPFALILDDQRSSQQLTCLMLRHLGYEAIIAQSLEEIEDVVQSVQLCLVATSPADADKLAARLKPRGVAVIWAGPESPSPDNPDVQFLAFPFTLRDLQKTQVASVQQYQDEPLLEQEILDSWLQIAGDERDDIIAMISRAVSVLPNTIEQIGQSWKQGETEAARELAHKTRGSLSSYGIKRMAVALASVEETLRSDAPYDLALHTRLVKLAEDSAAAVHDHLGIDADGA